MWVLFTVSGFLMYILSSWVYMKVASVQNQKTASYRVKGGLCGLLAILLVSSLIEPVGVLLGKVMIEGLLLWIISYIAMLFLPFRAARLARSNKGIGVGFLVPLIFISLAIQIILPILFLHTLGLRDF